MNGGNTQEKNKEEGQWGKKQKKMKQLESMKQGGRNKYKYFVIAINVNIFFTKDYGLD